MTLNTLPQEANMTFTVDTHHHILPDFFWRETNDPRNPVGGISPPPCLRQFPNEFTAAAEIARL